MTLHRNIECIHCKYVFEYIGTRLPNYCPECGMRIFTMPPTFDILTECQIEIKQVESK